MGKEIPGDWDSYTFFFFWPPLVLLLPRDSGKGLECGRGWPLNSTTVLSRRNCIPCPVILDGISFALSQRGEVLRCSEKMFENSHGFFFFLHSVIAVSTS